MVWPTFGSRTAKEQEQELTGCIHSRAFVVQQTLLFFSRCYVILAGQSIAKSTCCQIFDVAYILLLSESCCIKWRHSVGDTHFLEPQIENSVPGRSKFSKIHEF